MRTNFALGKTVISFLFLILVSFEVMSQKELAQFLVSGKSDANKLSGYYLKPFLKSYGNNMNNGWYSTAEPLKLGRFNISIGGVVSSIPGDEQSFVLNPSEYGVLKTTGNNSLTLPTIFGENTSPNGVNVEYSNSMGSISYPLKVPAGTGYPYSPLPIVQLNVGLIKGTEVMLRYFPSLNYNGYKNNYLGIGLKHDIKQWIPVINKLPFDMSIAGAYTNAELEVVGGPFLSAETGVSNPNPMDISGQLLSYKSNAWNASLLISKKLPVLTIFGGFIYSSSKTNFDLKGNYPITVISNLGQKEIAYLSDPLNLEGNNNQIGLNAGIRVKILFMAIVAEGVFSPNGYSSANARLQFGLFN